MNDETAVPVTVVGVGVEQEDRTLTTDLSVADFRADFGAPGSFVAYCVNPGRETMLVLREDTQCPGRYLRSGATVLLAPPISP
jgi:hypothetical protein